MHLQWTSISVFLLSKLTFGTQSINDKDITEFHHKEPGYAMLANYS